MDIITLHEEVLLDDGTLAGWQLTFDTFDLDELRNLAALLVTEEEIASEYGRVEREYGEYLALLEQERHEAEDEYLATCYGHQMSVQDESTAGDPGEW